MKMRLGCRTHPHHTTRTMHRTILGIEGTAWNLSAGVVTETDILAEATATYHPATGGIHPREAAQHHAAHIASVIRKAIKSAGDVEIDGIAFSQGPGMGPCLRTVATAARALSLSLDVPLIGVNQDCCNSGPCACTLARCALDRRQPLRRTS
jgi:tRNA A37 threonylcarbamoyltransferase TsaD